MNCLKCGHLILVKAKYCPHCGAKSPHDKSNSGWLYVMINPSMEGIVKIGKTSRDPQERLKELSSATGVPTPFILAYSAYFSNCSEAEQYVHARLDEINGRVSDNREFFNVPLQLAIKVVLEAESQLDTEPDCQTSLDDDDDNSNCEVLANNVYDNVSEQAEIYYYGLNDSIIDYQEALKLFKQASKMGSNEADRKVGNMYRDGEGCNPNINKALQYYKQGVKRGNALCYAEMAILFDGDKQDHINLENSNKCWKAFFESDVFQNIDKYDPNEIVRLAFYYVWFAQFRKRQVNYKDKLYLQKNNIISFAERKIEYSKENGKTNIIRSYQDVIELMKSLKKEEHRISLSMKSTTPNPWEKAVEMLHIKEGSVMEGKVVRLTKYGAFIDLDLGGMINGLAHISEMSWAGIEKPDDVVKVGDTVKVMVLSVNKEEHRISLSMKRTTTNPWEKAVEMFQEGKILNGIVERVVSFGAFVKIHPEFEGLVHISEVADEDIKSLEGVLKEGQEVKVKVLKVDSKEQKIALSIKRVKEEHTKKEVERCINEHRSVAGTRLRDLLEGKFGKTK